MRPADPEEQLSPAITKDIEKIILNMVNHIREISAFHTIVSAITLFFKIDDQSRIWLLHCSRVSIKRSDRDPDVSAPCFVHFMDRENSPVFRYKKHKKVATRAEILKTMLMVTKNDFEFHPNEDQRHCTLCFRTCCSRRRSAALRAQVRLLHVEQLQQ